MVLVDFVFYRLITERTVDANNLGPTGTMTLDPTNFNQPTQWLYGLCLYALTVHGNELRLLWAKALPLLLPLKSHN